MNRDFDFEEVIPREASERQLRAVWRLRLEIEKEEMPDDPPKPFEEFASELRTIRSYMRPFWWLAWDKRAEELLGLGWLDLKDKPENRHISRPWVEVHPSARRQGLGSQLAFREAQKALADGRTLAQSYSLEGGPGVGFCDWIGMTHEMTEGHNRLRISDMSPAMLDEWIDRAAERAADYSLISWVGPTPDKWLEPFARLRFVMNTAPRPPSEKDEVTTAEEEAEWDETVDREGWICWTLVAQHDPTGEWAGYTRIWPSNFRKIFAYQDDTGVDHAHRNKGLGRWLKAAMLKKLISERPEAKIVVTWNATENEAMISINNALGFKRAQAWQIREIPISDLISRLS